MANDALTRQLRPSIDGTLMMPLERMGGSSPARLGSALAGVATKASPNALTAMVSADVAALFPKVIDKLASYSCIGCYTSKAGAARLTYHCPHQASDLFTAAIAQNYVFPPSFCIGIAALAK